MLGSIELSVVLIVTLLCAWISARILHKHGLFRVGFALGLLLGPLGIAVSLFIYSIKH